MKLKRLMVENITSLRGKHEIDFNSLFSLGDLFAITGPTGSGKSSLLTAISLALFGKNYKKALNSVDFVSLGESEGKIVLDFEQSGKEYTCYWACKVLKKDGSPIKNPTPRREAFCHNSPIEDSIEDILGLNFDQFCKTVIINQGEFHRFVTSNFSERKDILEKLIDGSKLSQLAPFLNKLIKDEQHQVDLLKVKLDHGLPFDNQEIEIAKKKLEEIVIPFETTNIAWDLTKKIVPLFKDILEIYQKVSETEKKADDYGAKIQVEIQNANLLLAEKESKEADLKSHLSETKEKRPLYEEALKTQTKLKNTSTQIKKHEIEIKEIDSRIKKTKVALRENEKSSKDVNNAIEQFNSESLPFDKLPIFEKYLNKALQIETKLSSKQENRDEARAELENKSHRHLGLEKTVNDNFSQLQSKLNEQSITIDKNINRSEVLQLVEDLLGKFKSQIELIQKDYNQYCQNEERLKINRDLVLKSEEEANEFSYKLMQKQNELKELNLKIEGELNRRNTLERQLKIQELRKEAIENNNCPVCEQDCHHIEFSSKFNLDEVREIDLENIRELQENLKNETLKLSERLSYLREQKRKYSSETSKLEIESYKLAEKWFKAETGHLGKFQELIENKQRDQESINSLKMATSDYFHQVSNLSLSKKETEGLKEKISFLDKDLEESKSTFSECLNYLRDIFESKAIKLKDLQEEYKSVRVKEKQFTELKNKQKILEERFQALNSQLIIDEEQFVRLSKDIDLSKQQEIKLNSDIRKVCGDSTPEVELKIIDEKTDLLREVFEKTKAKYLKVEKERDQFRTALGIVKDQLKDFELLKTEMILKLSKIIESEKVVQLKTKYSQDSLDKDIHSLLGFLDKLASLNQDAEFMSTYGHDLQLQIIKISERLSTKREELLLAQQENKNKVDLFESKKAEFEKDQKLFEEKKNSLERYLLLNQVLGKNDFRNFALTLIEKQLISQANMELESLCDGRYQIKQYEKKGGSDFYIEDRWSGGSRRKISTLSGGETFLISLATALALAELSRGTTEIDSFFIDEGFGSLDSEAIDEVLEVLMTVRSRGKQIGIISHVKHLTDRIPLNVQLHKNQTGGSEISVNYN